MTRATSNAIVDRGVRRVNCAIPSASIHDAWERPVRANGRPLIRASTLEAIFTLAYDAARRTYVLIRGAEGSRLVEDIDEGVAIAITDQVERGAKLKALRRPRLAVDGLDLKPKEVLVLQAVADGLTNRAIALKLRITENTVKRHNQHIFAKLGVQSRTQAVLVGLECGLISRSNF